MLEGTSSASPPTLVRAGLQRERVRERKGERREERESEGERERETLS